jgi:hypothetical protein
MKEFICYHKDLCVHSYIDYSLYFPEVIIVRCTQMMYYSMTIGKHRQPHRTPPIEELIERLNDPQYMTFRNQRGYYIETLLNRNDPTETHKRLLKMYYSKL